MTYRKRQRDDVRGDRYADPVNCSIMEHDSWPNIAFLRHVKAANSRGSPNDVHVLTEIGGPGPKVGRRGRLPTKENTSSSFLETFCLNHLEVGNFFLHFTNFRNTFPPTLTISYMRSRALY